MLDVEFLQAAKPAIRQHTAYTYRTRFHLGSVLNKLVKLYESRGLSHKVAVYSPDEFIGSLWAPSLFGENVTHVDLQTATEAKIRDAHLIELLQGIITKSHEHTFIISAPLEHPLLKTPHWASALKQMSQLEEPTLNNNNLETILNYHAANGQFSDLTQLTNFNSIHQAISHLILNEEDFQIADLIQVLALIDLNCVDLNTKTFDIAHFKRIRPTTSRENFYKLHELISSFLMDRSQRNANVLLQYLDHQHHGQQKEARLLYGALYRATNDLMSINALANPAREFPPTWSAYKQQKLDNFKTIPLKTLFHWQVFVTEYESEAINVNFSSAIHRICERMMATDQLAAR